MQKVAGIGNALIDVFVDGSDAAIAQAGLKKGKTHLVSLKEWGEYAKKFPMVFTSPGGAMCNILSTLSLVGLECQMVASIGKDSFGTTLKDHCGSLKINLENANVTENEITGRVLIIATPDHVETHVVYLGACVHLSGQHVSMHAMLDSKALILEGYLVSNESAREAIERGVEIAHIQNIVSVLTFSGAKMVQKYREYYQRYIEKNVNITSGNIAEYMALLEVDSVTEVIAACKDRDTLSVITRGAEGAILCQKGDVIEIPPVLAKKVLDRTGASDQFLAGFLAAYLKGAKMQASGRFGAVLGSAVIEQISGIFHRDIKDIVARAT